jgi:hypothetical protein
MFAEGLGRGNAWIVLAAALVLGGCAFGQRHSYEGAPMRLPEASAGSTVAVAVLDARPYVASGGKPESFTGLMRGGFGNPFDVNTESGKPLAVEMRDALAKSMTAKGMTVTPVDTRPSDSPDRVKRNLAATNARRLVLVVLREWKSDTMMNTALIHDVTLEVLDPKGELLASNQAMGRDNLGSLGFSHGQGVAASFVRKFEALFDQDKVVAALK